MLNYRKIERSNIFWFLKQCDKYLWFFFLSVSGFRNNMYIYTSECCRCILVYTSEEFNKEVHSFYKKISELSEVYHLKPYQKLIASIQWICITDTNIFNQIT